MTRHNFYMDAPRAEVEEFSEHYNLLFAERTEPLHVMLLNCGHQRVTNHSYIWNGLQRGKRNMFIWQYTISGHGELQAGKELYSLYPGDAFQVVVPGDHCYRLPESSTEWEFIYVSINGIEAIRLAEICCRRGGMKVTIPHDDPILDFAWKGLLSCRNHELENRYAASYWAYRFMMQLLAKSTPDKSGNRKMVKKVHDYILENLNLPITVDDLAGVCGCSRWHFSRIFREESGMSPHEFTMDLRSRMAIRLLQTSKKSVKEIAEYCGFEDVSYFCRCFKKVHGISPGKYRKE